MTQPIAVIGAGSWGTALARLLAEKGKDVTLWAYEPEVVQSINEAHENTVFLPGYSLPENLTATNDIAAALHGKPVVLSVVPTQALRSVWTRAAAHLDANTIIVSCSKGIEIETMKLPSDILTECLPNHPADRIVCLSGPSFAKEVARGLPTAVTIAGQNAEATKIVQSTLRTHTFLTYTHHDMIGVEVGGALKNVIAIATGASDGLGFGMNARAAVITRGLYEIIQMGQAMGAKAYTFMGLAGIGDLVLTSTDEQSRNYTVGYRLGKGEAIADIIASMKMVAEGYKTCVAARRFAETRGINANITVTVHRMLYESLEPRRAAEILCRLSLSEELRSIQWA